MWMSEKKPILLKIKYEIFKKIKITKILNYFN